MIICQVKPYHEASGFQGGLGALCHNFGLEVEEDQSSAGASSSGNK